MTIRICLLFLTLLLNSCGLEEQKSYSKLEGLRILGVIADSPQINGPQAVTLTPYLSYVDGGDTVLQVSYKACLDPGIAFGADISCDDADPAMLIEGTTNFATSTIGSGNFYTGEMTPISINVGADVFAFLSTLDPVLTFNGLDLIVILTVLDQSQVGQKIEVLKRISLTTKTSGLNSNPTIPGDFEADGSNFINFPDKTVKLSLPDLSDEETYELKSDTETSTLTETMTVSWFSNAGSLSPSRSSPEGTSEFDPKEDTAGVFVAVYRDGRGGIAVLRKVLP